MAEPTAALADVLAPQNDEGTKATILKWCKSAGDRILKDEPLLELETDKVTVEIPSPASGELAQISNSRTRKCCRASSSRGWRRCRAGAALRSAGAAPGAPAPDATAGGTAPASRAAATPDAEQARGRLSPAVRRMLRENALRVDDIPASARDGRITAQDVARRIAAPPAARPAAAPASTRVPHPPIRRRVAEHMVRSLEAAPHVTTLFEADLTRVQAHRARHAAEYERRGTRLTLTAYFVAACARALAANPAVNATYHEDGLELHSDANIGVGTALGNEGLIVPVIHAAQNLDLPAIAGELGRLVAAARAGRLTPQEVRGGTFTLSNHGVGGSLLAAPIVINQPQVAILGVGKVERRVCVIESGGAESIGIRTLCYVTLTIDHRALDAFQANAFLSQVVASLEQWGED